MIKLMEGGWEEEERDAKGQKGRIYIYIYTHGKFIEFCVCWNKLIN